MFNVLKYTAGITAGAVMVAGTFVMPAPAWADDDDDNDRLPLYLTRTLDATAQDTLTPGFIWQGAGNPATNFMVKTDPDNGIELAIKAIIRQGPDIRPTYVDHRGRVHVEVPSGPQPGNPARAAWNFTYSYNTSLPGAAASLDNYEAELWIDLDPSDRQKYLKLKLAKLGPPSPGPEPDRNGYGWKNGSTVVIPDDEGTQRVTQNSQNYAFYAALIDTNPSQPGIQPYTFGPGEFDVVLKIKEKRRHGHNARHGGGHDEEHGNDGITVHVVFNVVDP
jgi:hypothetical protein